MSNSCGKWSQPVVAVFCVTAARTSQAHKRFLGFQAQVNLYTCGLLQAYRCSRWVLAKCSWAKGQVVGCPASSQKFVNFSQQIPRPKFYYLLKRLFLATGLSCWAMTNLECYLTTKVVRLKFGLGWQDCWTETQVRFKCCVARETNSTLEYPRGRFSFCISPLGKSFLLRFCFKTRSSGTVLLFCGWL